MVHSKDDCASALEKLGAEIVLGDLLEINTIRAAMEGLDAAYFCWPVEPGLIHATVNFAQAAKEAGVSTIINLSRRSANRDSTSDSCRDSFIAEQVFRVQTLHQEFRSSGSFLPVTSHRQGRLQHRVKPSFSHGRCKQNPPCGYPRYCSPGHPAVACN
jgi:NAD(P)H-binding